MLSKTEEKVFGQDIQDLEHKFKMANQDLFYPLKGHFASTSDNHAIEKFIVDALRILDEQAHLLIGANDDIITDTVINSVNSAKEPFLRVMDKINKSLDSNPKEQERFINFGSDLINRLANYMRDEVLYPHLAELTSENLGKNEQNILSDDTHDEVTPIADSQSVISNDVISHKEHSKTFLNNMATDNLSPDNEKTSSIGLPEDSPYQTIGKILKKQEELKVEIRQQQEAIVKCQKQNSEYQNDFDNFYRGIESIDTSKDKNLPVVKSLSLKATMKSDLIKANNNVIENNKKTIQSKSQELEQLEKQKQSFYTQDHFTHMESLSDSDAKSKDKISSNLLLKTLSNIGDAIGIVGRLIFCFAFDLKASEQDINKILKSEPTQEGKNKSRGCFSFMGHFFDKSKFNIPEPTYMSNMAD